MIGCAYCLDDDNRIELQRNHGIQSHCPVCHTYLPIVGFVKVIDCLANPTETVEIDGETLVVERISTDDKPRDMNLDPDKVKTLKLDPDNVDISKEMAMMASLKFPEDDVVLPPKIADFLEEMEEKKMSDNYEKEVYFDQYCKTCEHNDKMDYEHPCTECMESPANIETHRPVKWEPQDHYAELVYKIVKKDADGIDAIYQDYIIQLVGNKGFIALKENNYIETCGVIDGRQLYTLK